jgi:hypothetical protein
VFGLCRITEIFDMVDRQPLFGIATYAQKVKQSSQLVA